MDPTHLTASLPASHRHLLDDIHKILGEVYLTGGFLREILRHAPLPGNLDLLVSIPLTQCQTRLSHAGYKNLPNEKKQNSLILPLKREDGLQSIDLSTFRHRPGHPITVEEDLLHRDMTINAMAYLWPHGPLFDPFGGREDLQKGFIRLVNGQNTLREDPLRAVRFFRFVIQLAGTPNPPDLAMAEETTFGIVSQEKLRTELDLLFSLPFTNPFHRELLAKLFASPLGRTLLPELNILREQITPNPKTLTLWDRAMAVFLEVIPCQKEDDFPLMDLRWCALLAELGMVGSRPGKSVSSIARDAAVAATPFLDRLKFTTRRKKRILSILEHLDMDIPPSERALRRMITAQVPLEGLIRLSQARHWVMEHLGDTRSPEGEKEEMDKILRRSVTMHNALKGLSPHHLALSGGDLLEIGRMPPGPWLSALQHHLMAWVEEDPDRNRPHLIEKMALEWILERKKKD